MFAESEIDLNSVETLVRYGTLDTVADFVAQGRADELRALGYRGELPPES